MMSLVPRTLISISKYRLRTSIPLISKFANIVRITPTSATRTFSLSSNMSTQPVYSTTNTGSKPEDPYKEANLDHASLKERVEDLLNFIEGHKFCLMTTRQHDTGYLVSRCMAVAAREGLDLFFHTNTESGKTDELVGDPHINIGFLKETNVGHCLFLSAPLRK